MRVKNLNTYQIESKIKEGSVLLIDLDGTLIDTDMANYLAYKNAFESVTKTKFDFSPENSGRFNRESLKNIFPNLTDPEIREIISRKKIFYNQFLSETNINEVVAEIIEKYGMSNQTILVTNSGEERAMKTLEYHRFTDKFDEMFFRENEKNSNEMNKYLKALTGVKFLPTSAAVFENEKNEIEKAMKIGIPSENIIFVELNRR